MWSAFKGVTKFSSLDNDECKRDEHKCEQNCINTIGGYRCSCNLGYILDSNGFNCTGTLMPTLQSYIKVFSFMPGVPLVSPYGKQV